MIFNGEPLDNLARVSFKNLHLSKKRAVSEHPEGYLSLNQGHMDKKRRKVGGYPWPKCDGSRKEMK